MRLKMEERILELSKSYSAILATGPRQAGKTTMLQSFAEKENIGREYVILKRILLFCMLTRNLKITKRLFVADK